MSEFKFGDLVLLGRGALDHDGVLNMIVAPRLTIAFFSAGKGLMSGTGLHGDYIYRYTEGFTAVDREWLEQSHYPVPEDMK